MKTTKILSFIPQVQGLGAVNGTGNYTYALCSKCGKKWNISKQAARSGYICPYCVSGRKK